MTPAGRSFGVAVATLLFLAATLAHAEDSDESVSGELSPVKEKLNGFFDTFDGVITDQAVRLNEGKGAGKDQKLNEKLLKLVEVAEDLEDEIFDEADREAEAFKSTKDSYYYDDSEEYDSYDYESTSEEAMDMIEEDAADLVDEAEDVVETAEDKLGMGKKDVELKDELVDLKYKASSVLEAIERAKLKKMLQRRKNKRAKEEESSDEVMLNDKASPLWVDPLSGTPADRPDDKDMPDTWTPNTESSKPDTLNPDSQQDNKDPNAWNPNPNPQPYVPPSNPNPQPYVPPSNPNPQPYVPPSNPNPQPYVPPSNPNPQPYVPPSNPNPQPYVPPSNPNPQPYVPPSNPNPQPYVPPSNTWNPNPNPNPDPNPYVPPSNTNTWNPNPKPEPKPYVPPSDPNRWNPNPNPNPAPYVPPTDPNRWNPNPNPQPQPQPDWQPKPLPNPNPQPIWNPNPQPQPEPQPNWKPNPQPQPVWKPQPNPQPQPVNPGSVPTSWNPNWKPNNVVNPPKRYDDGLGRSNRQYYDTTGLEKYIQGCTDCVEATDNYECKLNNEVLEMKKWASEVQELLSFGCPKPESCQEPGVCCINDKYPFKQTVVQMTQMLKDIYNMFQDKCKSGCKEKYQPDPAWSSWGAWSACDATCGRGLRQRNRLCDNPAPASGQAYCPGKPMEIENCQMGDCCVDGNWTPWNMWSSCSATCGQGFKQRARSCSSPAPNSCGRQCDGPASDVQQCQGAVASCCVDGNWSPWMNWGACSATCGQGVQERARMCNSPFPNHCGRTCPGQGKEMQPCSSGQNCCVDGNWSSWTRWAPCSATCGKGVTNRKRRCDSPSPNYCGSTCPGPAEDQRECGNPNDCCQDGNWSFWSTWSTCSQTCGNGLRSRIRRCDNPSPNFCGQRCPGSPYDTISCKEKDCCVDGNWGQWGSWEGCSTSCGRGNQIRRRLCDSPGANFCGQTCPGAPVDLRPCDQGNCCVNGNWASWSSWTMCSDSCGNGMRTRGRSCSNPPANFCGTDCPGESDQSGPCDSNAYLSLASNGNWGSWQQWSACSASCGDGSQYRSRACNNPPAGPCGNQCPGPMSDTRACNNGQCAPRCRDGNWAPWGSWTMCSDSCGNGMRSRARSCSNPPANFCGNTCPGEGTQNSPCDRNAYLALASNGNWGTWEQWSACSASCGEGTQYRARDCNNPPAGPCGTTCPGYRSDSRNCNNGQCAPRCRNGNWANWSSWTACSDSCGNGVVSRVRSCSNPPPNFCGTTCPGDGTERQACDQRPFTALATSGNWGNWQQWSACSASCGDGTQYRSRECNNPPAGPCGGTCPGQRSDSRNCNNGQCAAQCRDGNWSSWNPWSQCSDSCGNGVVTRVRTCSDPPPNYCGRTCPGDDEDRRPCDQRRFRGVSVDGNWGSWNQWATCSATCGDGTTTRYRQCNSPAAGACGLPCPGQGNEQKRCSGGPCALRIKCRDGNWSFWSSWTQCSDSCGNGMRGRFRTCSNPPANACGRTCPGDKEDYQPCDRSTYLALAVDGNWGPWMRWSTCTKSCDGGTRQRRRLCDSPSAGVCGRQCPGSDYETDDCNLQACVANCIDGNWGTWSRWSECSEDCANGVRTKRRQCNNPPANFCGQQCPGKDTTYEQCNNADSRWSTWQRWGPCSVSCGSGVEMRTRTCDDPTPNSCPLADCKGEDNERRRCDKGPCALVDCVRNQWTTWAQWTSCSVSCGQGRRQRARTCQVSRTNSCNNNCPGDDVEEELCNQPACGTTCVDSQWTTWSGWATCTVTCGPGITSRTRQCQKPPTNYCGNPCEGQDSERKWCLDIPCPVAPQQPTAAPVVTNDISWTTWGSWASCDCGNSLRSRTRQCVSRSSRTLVDSARCQGDPSQEEKCSCTAQPQPQPEPQPHTDDISWTTWSTWKSCDCKTGIKERSRQCVRRSTRTPVDYSRCSGSPTQQERCNTRDECPECVQSCSNRNDGTYPSCTSCSEYVRCSGGQMRRERCDPGYQYDSSKRTCVRGTSSSCTISECTDDCRNKPDGRYQSCGRCNSYAECYNGRLSVKQCAIPTDEFNANLGYCESAKSPTCPRASLDTGRDSRIYWVNDEATEAAEDNETMLKDKMAAQIGHENCIKSCEGLKAGLYPSCNGCSHFIVCTQRGAMIERDCFRGKIWDNNRKRCLVTSSTCQGK